MSLIPTIHGAPGRSETPTWLITFARRGPIHPNSHDTGGVIADRLSRRFGFDALASLNRDELDQILNAYGSAFDQAREEVLTENQRAQGEAFRAGRDAGNEAMYTRMELVLGSR